MSVSRRLGQLCPYGLASSPLLTANVSIQAWGLSGRTLTCKSSSVPQHPSELLLAVASRPNSCVVIVPSLLISNSSELTMALDETTVVLDHDCSELRREGPPSLLCSDSLVKISALARPVLNSVCTELRHKGTTELAK
ncbi:hypothetical protein Acr_03g0015910 [Actinidia rufa]|uniref:Uncharacterized protein n=1 Tax=Actinidia rufa TaxID=165716 RepID=A0A7J0EGQ3_9ERIC|nr:hypothetical protein Acr_03g0015910 [Actinidia rufa]